MSFVYGRADLGPEPIKGHQRPGYGSDDGLSEEHRWLADTAWFRDDFRGDSLAVPWAEGGNVGGSAVVVDGETGGIVRMSTSGLAAEAWYIYWNNVRSLLASKNVVMEYRLKALQTANQSIWPSLLNDANDLVRFRYDSLIDANWYALTVDGATTAEDTGVALDTDYHIFRIECSSTLINFFIDGVETNDIATNISTDYFQPYIGLYAQDAVVKQLDLDYVTVVQDR